jgi:hypothetical protein
MAADTVQVWNDIKALNTVFTTTPAKVLISWVAVRRCLRVCGAEGRGL